MVELRSNSPTEALIDDIVNELGGQGSFITPLDTIKIYSGANLVATLTPTITRVGSDITLEAQYQNTGANTITIDKTEVLSGTKVYFINTTQYNIAPGETKTIRVIISISVNPLGMEANTMIAKRLTGEYANPINFRDMDLIGSGGAIAVGLPITLTADTTNNQVTIQAQYTPSVNATLTHIGVTINGLVEDPTIPAGYGYLAQDTSTLNAGVTYTITVTITVQ